MLIIRCVSEPMSLILEPVLLVGPLFVTVSSVCSTVSLQYHQCAVYSVCSTISLQYHQCAVSSVCSTISLQYHQSAVPLVCCAENRTEGTHAGGIIEEEKNCICFIKDKCFFSQAAVIFIIHLKLCSFSYLNMIKAYSYLFWCARCIYCCSVC